MFTLALFFGLYSYGIFALGIFGIVTKSNCIIFSTVWFIILLFFERGTLISIYNKYKEGVNLKKLHKRQTVFLVILFIFLAIVNLIGALGPELAFDALWYHLTLPKLYLLHHSIYHIPGGLLYYSDMPKLGEMLYTGALSFGNEILAKLIHFIFGILVSVTLYKFSRKFLNQKLSLLIVVIFYSNLVVDWESITAYIDLIRTFFELLAVWGFINWYETQKNKWLVVCGVMMGLAITTKVLAIGSFFIFALLILIISLLNKKSVKEIASQIVTFTFFSLLIPLPWFIFSFINTGNPVYPFFTPLYAVAASSPNPFHIAVDLWNLFLYSADPISPVYIIFLPLLFVTYRKFNKSIKLIVLYCGLSLILWYFTPRTGGGRFILPYLPAFSFVCGAIYSEILKKTSREWEYISKLLLLVILLVSIISIGYRGLANAKYIPVVFGHETKSDFLSKQLNFHFGDFYDTDWYFSRQIKPADTVLLFGFHNLYYVDFPFIDATWVKRGDRFTYIATQNIKLPLRFANWRLVYSNDKTMVKLYKPPKGICPKICYY